ncbi:Major Facilitator Superfamily protein [Nonomuraea jiangxiensis]|uniref:Major Facilitator Superfamily protein n=2 Tax=Nonomuraea jiangxiensis TaxID=633440 RepID=A0A1G9RH86_9ACTN|nr:Major Facilitator Superfamily protein [Nonomuraea jiangxiensis]
MVGAVAARTGDEMSGPALLVTGLAVTGSPVTASWLLAGLTVSAAVGGPLLGVLLDRVRRPGRALAWCLAGYAGGLLLVVHALGRVPAGAVIAVAVATGLLGPALTGGWTAQLPLAAGGPERLARANALDSMSYNVAGLAGPAVVGVVAAMSGGMTATLVCVALLTAALPIAWTLPAHERPERGTPRLGASVLDSGGRGTSIRGELAEGFGAIVRNRALRRATAGSMVSCCGLAMLVVSAPVLAAELTGEAGHGALLLAVTAACGLAANALMARRDRPWDVVLGWATAVLGVGMALAALAGSFWIAVVAAAVAGAGEGPQLTALFAVRHREAPARLRSQVFTTGASLKITSFALGSAVSGPLAAYSAGWALLAGAALQAAALAVLAPWRR